MVEGNQYIRVELILVIRNHFILIRGNLVSVF